MCKEKIGALSQLGAKKIVFPPKPDGIQTDISNYRVASLLKTTDLSMAFGTNHLFTHLTLLSSIE